MLYFITGGTDSGGSTQVTQQSITDCVNNRGVSKQFWDRKSPQNSERVNAVRDMIITTGYPVTFIDQPGVRNMLRVFDPKFPVLGMNFMMTLFCTVMIVFVTVAVAQQYC